TAHADGDHQHAKSPLASDEDQTSADAPQVAKAHSPSSQSEAPFYLPLGNEVEIFQQCHEQGMAVMLKGPTGCGKTRFVEYMAWQLGRPLITIACHDDLSASDLIGRFLISEGATVW